MSYLLPWWRHASTVFTYLRLCATSISSGATNIISQTLLVDEHARTAHSLFSVHKDGVCERGGLYRYTCLIICGVDYLCLGSWDIEP